MTYRGIVTNGVVVLDGPKPVNGTIVEVSPVAADEFWQSRTREELAQSQGVRPLMMQRDLRNLAGRSG